MLKETLLRKIYYFISKIFTFILLKDVILTPEIKRFNEQQIYTHYIGIHDHLPSGFRGTSVLLAQKLLRSTGAGIL